jgi:cholesterol oxidase
MSVAGGGSAGEARTARAARGEVPRAGGRSASWISRGYEALASLDAVPGDAPAFDLVIVGSGYGGAIAAEAFARRREHGRPLRIAVLERGDERLAGSFPSRFAELPGEVRFARAGGRAVAGRANGLFDLRLGPDVCVLLANGLGGGSLINAGVMEPAAPAVFDDPRWPRALRRDLGDAATRAALHRRARERLGLRAGALGPDAPRPPKLAALARAVPGEPAPRLAPVTLAGPWGASDGAARLSDCVGCGDCATGCNHDAKDSLDRGLLVAAHDAGVRLYAGTTVEAIEPPPDDARLRHGAHWVLRLAPTDPMLAVNVGPIALRARRVILAAGALGSTELLARSRVRGLAVSARLGERAGTNGDAIHAVTGLDAPANAAADERRAPAARGVGPTISGIVDLRHESPPMVIEDLAVPGPLGRLFGETVATASLFARLGDADPTDHAARRPVREPFAVDPARVRRTALVAMMGDDGACGRIACDPGAAPGTATLDWPGAGERPIFAAQLARLRKRIGESPGAPDGPRVLPNPMWRLLPAKVESMIGPVRGPIVSVHPLGGCAMGESAENGVVDAIGRVFDPAPDANGRVDPMRTHAGLAVLDGAIVPCALGINPALTIAVLALRACDALWTEDWAPAGAPSDVARAPGRRPPLAPVSTRERRPRAPTEVEIVERLHGPATLVIDGRPHACTIELTLRFEPVRAHALASRHGARLRVARVSPLDDASLPAIAEARPTSELRILDRAVLAAAERDPRYASLEEAGVRRAATLLAVPVHGELVVLEREPSTRARRIARALRAWAGNRGLRDVLLTLAARREGPGPWLRALRAARASPVPEGPGGTAMRGLRFVRALAAALADGLRTVAAYVADLVRLASRAGEARRFRYRLRLGTPTIARPGWREALGGPLAVPGAAPEPGSEAGGVARGGPPFELRLHKRLAYVPRGNPFRQLTEARLDAFPLPVADATPPVLTLDAAWLARIRVPLLRIVRADSLPDAWADLGALGATLARMLVGVHLWSFRKPEPPLARAPRRLPGALPVRTPDGRVRTLEPELESIAVEPGERRPDEPRAGGEPPLRVAVRLSRYRLSRSTVGRPIVTLHGYSAGGTTFAHPALDPGLAAFFAARGRDVWVADLRTSCGLPETAARPWRFEDVAWNDIPAIIEHVRRVTGHDRVDVVAHCMGAVMLSMAVLRPPSHRGPWREALDALPGRLGRVVLTQGGPVLTFSPANRLRALVAARTRALFGEATWSMRASVPPSAADDLVDRLLAAMPYRDDADFRAENPLFGSTASTAWVRTRHRLDLLFAETFPMAPIERPVRDAIDDFFGEIHLETIAQTIRFAMAHRAASADGVADPDREFRTDPAWLAERWRFETRHFVGARNGVLDPSSVQRANAAFAGMPWFRAEVIEGYGHQDLLIGRDAGRFLERHVAPFLEAGAPGPGTGDARPAPSPRPAGDALEP